MDELLEETQSEKEKYYILGVEVSYEEMDRLSCEQAKGKELKVVDGKVVAVDHEVTDEELINKRVYEIQEKLNQLTQDFIQVMCGAVIDDIKERKQEFQALHNELRTLEGKEPRIYEQIAVK